RRGIRHGRAFRRPVGHDDAGATGDRPGVAVGHALYGECPRRSRPDTGKTKYSGRTRRSRHLRGMPVPLACIRAARRTSPIRPNRYGTVDGVSGNRQGARTGFRVSAGLFASASPDRLTRANAFRSPLPLRAPADARTLLEIFLLSMPSGSI